MENLFILLMKKSVWSNRHQIKDKTVDYGREVLGLCIHSKWRHEKAVIAVLQASGIHKYDKMQCFSCLSINLMNVNFSYVALHSSWTRDHIIRLEIVVYKITFSHVHIHHHTQQVSWLWRKCRIWPRSNKQVWYILPI